MYETDVPIPETTEERKPPTIAEIVREKTNDGARIIDFFLDVMEGRVADAKLCHRIDAAKQLMKYGFKKAADFIAEHGDETCDHCESRKRGPRPRKDEGPAVAPLHVQGPFAYDFLSLLTEDFLTVLSAVDEDLMIKLVRAQTRDAATVVEFLDDVMHSWVDGFRSNHRIAAAKELISHIVRDEHRSHILLDDVEPAPYSIRGADPRVRPLPGLQTPSPVGAGLKPALPGAARKPGNPLSIVPANEEGNPDNPIVAPANAEENRDTPTVVPAEAGTQRGGEGRSELSEEPTPTTANAPQPETRPRRRTRTQRRRAGNARAAILSRQVGPEPPGRSPPW